MFTEILFEANKEGGFHATSSVTTQFNTQNVVPYETQPGSAGNLNVTELLPQ
jgi:hypothetical protein